MWEWAEEKTDPNFGRRVEVIDSMWQMDETYIGTFNSSIALNNKLLWLIEKDNGEVMTYNAENITIRFLDKGKEQC